MGIRSLEKADSRNLGILVWLRRAGSVQYFDANSKSEIELSAGGSSLGSVDPESTRRSYCALVAQSG
ncbi:MAG: hypothetical protein C4318_06820 [Acidimicrobiia bacterium]